MKMKLQYLGTAAAEGIPAIFCQCEICKKARGLGGKEIRTRSQALLDDRILIDFPADTYWHELAQNLGFAPIKHLLVTHTHSDHFYPKDLAMRKKGFSYREDMGPITVYGSREVGQEMAHLLEEEKHKEQPELLFQEVQSLCPFAIEDYTILPFRSCHDPAAGPLCYIISHAGKTMLYGHDSGYYFDEVWKYMKEHAIHLDFASLDCTAACSFIDYDAHGNLERDAAIRDRLIQEGIADLKTVFCLNHFSHNGKKVLYQDFLPIARQAGFMVSYDGMTVEF